MFDELEMLNGLLAEINAIASPAAPAYCTIAETCAQIRSKFYCRQKSGTLSENYLRCCMQELVTLINRAANVETAERKSTPADSLMQLFKFLATNFREILTGDYPVPANYIELTDAALFAEIKRVRRQLYSYPVNGELKEEVDRYLRKDQDLWLRHVDYLTHFVPQLMHFLERDHFTDQTHEFCNLLYLNNFNSIGYLNWHQENIYSTLDALNTPSQKQQFISAQLQELTRARIYPVAAYAPPFQSTKAFMRAVLNEELLHVTIALSCIPKKETDPKIRVTLSVAQLGCLLRLLKSEGVFGDAATSDLLRFAVNHFHSKKQDDFSFRNLSKEYYGVSQVSAAVIRNLLQKMLAAVNRNYFPVMAVICSGSYFA